jgi:chromate transporter
MSTDSSPALSFDLAPLPTPWQLLRAWLALGAQSFGGGSATMALIRQAVVEKGQWVSESDFTRDWALCQMTPGINLLAFTILMGRRLGGTLGIFICLFGLLFPSVLITVLLTAFYAHIRDSEVVKAAVRGVVPATVGIGLVTAWQTVRAPLKEAQAEGKGALIYALFLLVGSAALFVWLHPPVVLILGGTGILGAVYYGLCARAAKSVIVADDESAEDA